jgi:hypothetical protein
MRSALLTSLILVGLIALGIRSHPLPPTFLGGRLARPNAEPAAEAKVPITFEVESQWMKSVEDAEQDALQEAQALVTAHLHNLRPHIDWVPPLEYIQKRLVKSRQADVKEFPEDIGPMRRERLEIELTPKALREIVRLDREQRSHERMFWLAKVLAGVVAGLAAVAGYVHLDERTKGYYTTLLRVSTASLVAAVAAALWWLC